jgi:hypothetical protein
MSRELPAKPNLEHLKKQAKQLLHDLQQSKPDAVERFRTSGLSSTPANVKLADAQHVVARDYGFASWPKLKEHVDSLTLTPAEQLLAAVCASDARRVERVLGEHPELKAGLNQPLATYGDLPLMFAAVQRSDRKTLEVLLAAGADLQTRGKSWAGGMGVLDECAPEMAQFLIERGAAVDVHSAARLGLFEKLQELVDSEPALVHARGEGGQTPLHFACGVEIAQFLLDRGADIDVRDLRHESTPAQHMIRVVQASIIHATGRILPATWSRAAAKPTFCWLPRSEISTWCAATSSPIPNAFACRFRKSTFPNAIPAAWAPTTSQLWAAIARLIR